ncbi:hypothetical protein [Rummeliibacillus sp. SL167]|uniref:hypothetical protein n=1 Tax=Rummeliibacillus sp. SL167 TaxID=2579792 RepID=UPI0011B7955D|nr:hypothetical protein [Rummeliibacillus sp. SL167]
MCIITSCQLLEKSIESSKAAEVAQINHQSVITVLNNLCQKKNILQREKRNSYMFTHRIYAEFDDQIEYTKDKGFDVDYLSKNEYITRSEVERLCGFSSATSKRMLKSLRDQEKIILEGKSSKYKLRK